MKKISLTQGQFALVDDEDYEWLNKWKWCAIWNPSVRNFYARRRRRKLDNRGACHILMHREILNLGSGRNFQVDHFNHNTLDNRKSNLRIVTHRKNSENLKNKSKYGTGVSFDIRKKLRPYNAHAWLNGKQRHIGMFSTAEEAFAARVLWLKENS